MQKDKLLFTPGPLTTSLSVKEAMLHDTGSRDDEFIASVREIRHQLLQLGGVSQPQGYEAILMQGSGTFGVESVLSSVIPANGKLLVAVNGAYGERMVQMATRHRIPVQVLRTAENQTPNPDDLRRLLAADRSITHLAVVHCETTTGILNPIESIGAAVRDAGRTFVVDAMSSFGAIPIHIGDAGIDFLISSSNKCIQGVPGFSFVLAQREKLLASEGSARTLSLDLLEQWRGLEQSGQFRYTPPTHAILGFVRALHELNEEGGAAARGARYRRNHEVLVNGMRVIGFREYLPSEVQSCIITAFYVPSDPRFVFAEFYRRLSGKGFVIYPGKISQADTFRIGSIGHLFEADIRALLAAIHEALVEMEVKLETQRESRQSVEKLQSL
jgi:2-aminoethylphosphonate-pyruvate transaminase